jgi:curved DNA-binding protein CbpA
MTDPWQTLGVPEGADPEVVRAAYRQLVREHHPDRHASGTPRSVHTRVWRRSTRPSGS